MVILGLDVSTNTIGYAFIKNKKILDMGFIDISKQGTFKDKAYHEMGILDDNKYMEKAEKIIVEDSLSGFMGGKTRMQTIIKLAKFNAILGYILEDEFDIEVQNINPMTARKSVFGKARVKGIKAKDFVKMKIEEMYDTKKWCKHTARENWDKRNIDMYDGLVMSLYEEKA